MVHRRLRDGVAWIHLLRRIMGRDRIYAASQLSVIGQVRGDWLPHKVVRRDGDRLETCGVKLAT